MTEISLVMIVKNESKIIERCLDSVKSIIDSIVISDTGSTDNTVELIEKYLLNNNIKGKVYKDEWKNFGHNRSKSITNAQEWLKENKYDLTKTYLLTIDADMIFRIKPTFNKKMLETKDSWCIQQVNPSMTYYNKRIFRSSLRYKCIGVTHEYWGCDDKDLDGKLSDLYIDDIGDGGAKADKFERDIKLLTQGLIDEPKNERYYFYLAQSYSDFGNKDEAIKFYKKRIEAGGWHEEIFIAHMRVGDIYFNLNQNENAIYYWSLAYEVLPSRSETLYRIIHYYRLIAKNQLALLFLKTALKIVYPHDQVLFIEHNIYNYRLLEELSICGFYTDKRHQSFIACDHLLLSKDSPEHVKFQSYSNSFFYMNKLNYQTNKEFVLKIDEPFISSSPSLFKTKKGYTGNVRTVNYSINKNFQYSIRDENQHVNTKNYWINSDNNGIVSKKYEVLLGPDCAKKRDSHIKGLEDMRLCKINDDEYLGLAITFEYGNHNHPCIVLCNFDKNDDLNYYIKNILPTNYNDNQCQKNWAPFIDKNKLFAIYSHQPLTILEIDKKTGNTSVVLKKDTNKFNFDLSKIRGSTCPIKLSDGSWLMVVHDLLNRDTRKYFHRFMLYTSEWELKDISLPFYFKELYVEFTLSMLYTKEDNTVTIFFSKEDNTTELVTMLFDNIQWLPVDIHKWIIENI